MTMPSSMDKQSLRRMIRLRRKMLSPDYRRQAERRVCAQLSRFLRKGRRIGGYLATGAELDITPVLWRAMRQRARVFLPVIPERSRRLWFSLLGTADRWYRHPHYPLLEYAGSVLRAEHLDVLFVPCLAVDADGYRLGQGGGFYDTSLHAARSRRPLLVGVGFDCQRVDRVPREPWDICLDYLITESGLHRFARHPR